MAVLAVLPAVLLETLLMVGSAALMAAVAVALVKAPLVVLEALAQSASSGPARPVNSHRPTRGIYNA